MAVEKNAMIEGANIGFRNFKGEARPPYNDEGDRNFVLFLNNEMAKQMEEDGWNIRWNKPKDPDEDPRGMLNVAVKFEKYPPKVVMVTSEGRTELNEDNVGILDSAELENVDLIIRPYNYDYNGRTGTKAYLKTMYATIVEDDLDKKYAISSDNDFEIPF